MLKDQHQTYKKQLTCVPIPHAVSMFVCLTRVTWTSSASNKTYTAVNTVARLSKIIIG